MLAAPCTSMFSSTSLPAAQLVQHLRAQRAVAVAIDCGVLEEMARPARGFRKVVRHRGSNNPRRPSRPAAAVRVVQVMARAMSLRVASSSWQSVVLPPPDGAEMTKRSGWGIVNSCGVRGKRAPMLQCSNAPMTNDGQGSKHRGQCLRTVRTARPDWSLVFGKSFVWSLVLGAWSFHFIRRSCACSRNFSNSVLSTTTSREISASFAFEPMVLISRFISCARKSSVRPTGSLRVHAVVELLEMALQPRDFLRDVRAVGEKNDLFEHALLLDLRGFDVPRSWMRSINCSRYFTCTCGERFCTRARGLAHGVEARHQILARRCAPSFSRIPTIISMRRLERLLHGGPEVLCVRHVLVRLQHARRAHEMIERHVAGEF